MVATGNIKIGDATIGPNAHSPLLATPSETKTVAPLQMTASPNATRNPTLPSNDARPTVTATSANASQVTSSRPIDRRASVTTSSMTPVGCSEIRACTEVAIVGRHDDLGEIVTDAVIK